MHLFPGHIGAARFKTKFVRRWHAGVPEWSKGPDLSSGGKAFVGSNPTPCTINLNLCGNHLIFVIEQPNLPSPSKISNLVITTDAAFTLAGVDISSSNRFANVSRREKRPIDKTSSKE